MIVAHIFCTGTSKKLRNYEEVFAGLPASKQMNIIHFTDNGQCAAKHSILFQIHGDNLYMYVYMQHVVQCTNSIIDVHPIRFETISGDWCGWGTLT